MTSTTPPRSRRTPHPPRNPVAGVLHGLTQDPGRPRLTWYGEGGERIELSGHVLDNWVTKTANLLVEEYDLEPWSQVHLDLGAHWRALVWAMAVWRAGGTVVLPGAAAAPLSPLAPSSAGSDPVVVTADPSRHEGARDLVAVALPALARRFPGELPPGATDAAAAVMTYGDVLTFMPDPELDAPALVHTGGRVSHLGLLEWARQVAGEYPEGHRTLVLPHDDDALPVLAAALSSWEAGGSVVICAPEVATELEADPARRARLVASERVDD